MARTLEDTEASNTQTQLATTDLPETARRGNALLRQGMGFFTNPKYRTVHLAIITFALLAHLALHYATYYPPLREALGRLPYFRLHSLHEAEYLLIVVYAGLVFRLKGGSSPSSSPPSPRCRSSLPRSSLADSRGPTSCAT